MSLPLPRRSPIRGERLDLHPVDHVLGIDRRSSDASLSVPKYSRIPVRPRNIRPSLAAKVELNFSFSETSFFTVARSRRFAAFMFVACLGGVLLVRGEAVSLRQRLAAFHASTASASRLYVERPVSIGAVRSFGSPAVVFGCGAVLMSLWPPRSEDQAKLDASLRAQVQKGGQAARRKAAPRGAKSSFAGEHVPDRVALAGGRCRSGRPWRRAACRAARLLRW